MHADAIALRCLEPAPWNLHTASDGREFTPWVNLPTFHCSPFTDDRDLTQDLDSP
jgi:hypothetical protein